MDMPKIRVVVKKTVYEEVEIDSYDYIDRCDHDMNGIVNLVEHIKSDPSKFIHEALKNDEIGNISEEIIELKVDIKGDE